MLGSGCKINATWSSQCTRCCSSNSDTMGRGGPGIIPYYSALIPNSLRIFDMLCQNSVTRHLAPHFPSSPERQDISISISSPDWIFLYKFLRRFIAGMSRNREGLEPQPHAVSGSILFCDAQTENCNLGEIYQSQYQMLVRSKDCGSVTQRGCFLTST